MFVLLRALGYGDEAFLDRFVRHFDFLEGQWEKERNLAPDPRGGAARDLQARPPGEPLSAEAARVYFENAFFNPKRYDLTRVGRYKLNRKLGPEIDRLSDLFGIEIEKPAPDQSVLSPSEILASATYMLHLALHMADGESTYRIDDQDHFANRRIRSVGELIQNQVRVGLSRMERVVRERMTTQDVEAITPQTLINIRPVVAAVKEFFGTSPAVASSWTRTTRCRAWPTSGACPRSARAACPVSGPASRSVTSTRRTTAACARSRPPRARTSA